ncbi:DedA family protein [Actinomadura sp. 6N118]|uniref:DedA family protein n=1 Tax=Actinomadura sp. 6N118 TaxID=3375151 RepID=UPI0037B5EA09
MPKDLFGLPLWAALVAAILIIFVRGQAYYWIGRGLGAKIYTSRLGRRVGEERLRKVEALVARRGALAVFAAHWVAGLRHAIPICAGGMRMPLPRYLLATVLGSILWTSMVMLGGYALIWGWLEIAARSPLIAAAAGVAALALLVAYLAYRRHRAAEHPAETPDKDGAHV